jgi:hypothetical protein
MTPGADKPPNLWALLRALLSATLVVVAYYVLPDTVRGGTEIAQAFIFGLCVLLLAGMMVFLIIRPPAGGIPARGEGLLLTVVVSLAFFATVYYKMSHSPGQFSGLQTRTDGLYFTLVTAATVGYGDITPVSQTARIVVMVQIVFNLVFIGAAVSVSMERIKRRRVRSLGDG